MSPKCESRQEDGMTFVLDLMDPVNAQKSKRGNSETSHISVLINMMS